MEYAKSEIIITIWMITNSNLPRLVDSDSFLDFSKGKFLSWAQFQGKILAPW